MNTFADFKDFGMNAGDFLQEVVEKCQLCTYVIRDNKFIFANNKFAELLDLPPSEIAAAIPENLFNSIVHPDFRQQARLFYSVNSGQPNMASNIEMKIINRSGHAYWIKLDIQAIQRDSVVTLIGLIINITELKNAKELLEISEDRYRQIFENSKDAIFITKLDTAFSDINKSAERLTGYSKAELLQMTAKDICHPDSQHNHEDIYGRVLAGEEVIEEAFIKHKDNLKIPAELSHKRFIIRDTSFVHTVARDISERKLAEQALQNSEIFSRAVIENSPMGISVRSKTGKLLSCNRSWQRIWNKSDNDIRQDMTRERAELRFDKNDDYLGEWQPKIRHVYEHGGYVHIPEVRTVGHPQRGEHWVSQYFYAIRNNQGEVDKVVILTEDITERKKAELALRESESFNRAVIEKSPLGVSVRDKYGKLLSCNHAWQKIWDKSDEDIQNYLTDERTNLEFDKKDDYLKQWHSEIKQIYELGGHLHIPETRTLYHDSGKERWVSQYFYAIKNSNGNVEKVVILTEDITERKKAEQALSASEEKFREIAEMAPEGIYETDKNGKLLFANRQTYNIFGVDHKDVGKGSNIFKILHDDDLKRAKSNFRDLLAGKKTRPNEYLARKSDGSLINLLIHSSPVYRENEVVGIRGVIVDITERKHIENALRNSEERYRTVLNAAPLYIYAINPQGIITFIDGKQLAIDGLNSEDIMGKSIFEFYDSPDTRRLFEAALKGKFAHIHNFFINKTYESRFERQFGPDGKVVGLIGISIDITEIKKAKEALQETETKFRLLFENAGQPIFSISRDGIFLTLNEPAAVYLGGKPEDFIGKSMMDLFPPKIASYQIGKVRQAIDSGQKIIDEDKTIINGQTVWYIISIQPIIDSDGRINSALLIANDITQRKRLEIRDKAKSELLSSLRHTNKLTECFEFGFKAILGAKLYNRSIVLLINKNSQITHYSQFGFLNPKEITTLIALQSDNTILKKINQNGLKINNSYFLPVANSIFKTKIKKSNIWPYTASDSEKSWQDGDQFFIPLLGEKNKPEGWLIVDSPFNGKWPAKDEAVFMEELADIIVKKVHEIQSLEILQEERLALQEKNITLREVLAHIEEEKMEIRGQVAEEIDNSLIPVMKKLIKKDGSVNSTCYNILEHGLQALASSAGTRHIFSKLSPREIEICNIIKTGTSSKELAKTLNISLATVQKHRESIRRKLGLTNKSVNLATYLKG